jgi:hypothetical protein
VRVNVSVHRYVLKQRIEKNRGEYALDCRIVGNSLSMIGEPGMREYNDLPTPRFIR